MIKKDTICSVLDLKVKTVAVIGGNGAIGSAISAKLEESGIEVHKFSSKSRNSSLGYESSLPHRQARDSEPATPQFFDAIILSNRKRNTSPGIGSDFSINDFLTEKSNVSTTVINLASYIEKYKIDSNSKNFEYQREKIFQTQELEKLESELRFTFINLHLFTIYGHFDKSESFFTQIVQAAKIGYSFPCTPGEQLISLTHIDDLWSCVRRLLTEERPGTGAFSFWATPPIKIIEVLDKIRSFSRPGFKADFGALPYGGHELFAYSPEMFPTQIFPDHVFIDLEVDLERRLNNV